MRELIFLSLIVLLIILLYSNRENFDSDKYPLEQLIYKNNGSVIYTLKDNDKYLYKKYKQTSPYNIKQEVKILNSTDLSPNVIDYGDDFYIIERLDMTLEELVKKGMVNKNIIQKFIDFNRKLDLFKYKHLDLHWKNILWDDTKKEFKVIDWEHIRQQEPKVYNIPDKIYLSKKMDEYSQGGPVYLKNIAKNLVMKIYKGEEIQNEKKYISMINLF